MSESDALEMMPTWASEQPNGASDTPDHTSDWLGAIPVSMIVDGVGYSLCPGVLAMPPEVGEESEGEAWTVMTTLPTIEVGSVIGQTITVPTLYLCGSISSAGKLCLRLTAEPPSEDDAAAAGQEIPIDSTDAQTSTSAHARAPLTIGSEEDRPQYRPPTARPIMYVRLDNWRQHHIWAAIVDGTLHAWTDDSWYWVYNVEDYMIYHEVPGIPGSIYDPIDLPDLADGIEDADTPDPDGSDVLAHVPLCVIGDAGMGGPVLPTTSLRLGSCWIGDMYLEGGSQIMTRQSREITDDYGYVTTVSEVVINEGLPWVKCCELSMPWTSITWGRAMTLAIYGVYHAGTYVFRVVEY